MASPTTGVPLLDGTQTMAQGNLSKHAFAAQVTLTVLITGTLFLLFLFGFFFLLTRNVERTVVSTGVTDVVGQMAQDAKLLLSPEQSLLVSQAVAGLQVPNLSAADAQVQASNAELTKKAAMVMGIVAGLVLAIALGVFIGMKRRNAAVPGSFPDPIRVCLSAALGLGAVVVCELVFLYGIAAQYKPLDGNATRLAILDALIAAVPPPQSHS